MRCSECSNVVKPVVAIDIDGVLGDYHGHFLRFATQYFGFDMEKLLEMSLNTYDGSYRFSAYCMDHFKITHDDYKTCKLAYRQGGMKRSQPPNQGAMKLCSTVKQRAELWITTTRPFLSLDGIIKDTLFWLDLNLIQYDGLLYDDDKYVTLAERVDPERVVAVVDDQRDMYDVAAEVYDPSVPILYANGYNNAMLEGRQSRDSLMDIRDFVVEAIDEWEGAYATSD